MTKLNRRHSPGLRRRLIAATALSIFPFAAFAADVAPTPEGAQSLSAVLAAYFGQGGASAAPEGDHYAVTIDVAKMLAPLAAEGASFEAAPAKINVTEQGDGGWRIAVANYPTITAHLKDGDVVISIDGYKFDGVYDPAIAGLRSAEQKAEKSNVQLHSSKIDESFALGPRHTSLTGAAGSNGGLTASVHEEGSDVAMVITPKPAEGSQTTTPPPVTIRIGGVSLDVNVADLRSQQILDLWRFLVAHPDRAALAADEDGLKSHLRALLPFADKLDENFATKNVSVETAKGTVKLDGVKARFVGDKLLSTGDAEIQLAIAGIAPPPDVVPPTFHDLIPTAIDVDIKYGGYDYRGAIEEAIDDMHLAGEGPVISEPDSQKISAKMTGAGPINVTILPSHVVAPQIDLTLEGAFQIIGDRPVGKITVTARNFDNTVAAIKGAGPLATPQVLGGLTMAKGLGKAAPDGSIVWVAEYAADGAIKLNGLPLGKAPAH
jgi:hypothetical protein